MSTLPLSFGAPLPAYIPPDVDLDAVLVAVTADGVSAAAVDEPALREVVSGAARDGVDLKIVVIENNPPYPPLETPLRDIATAVGQANPGSTVLVLSPSFAGTYSTQFDRVTLEAGEDLAKTGNPVQSAQNFVGQLNTPDFPWTALTVVLLMGVFLAAVATRAMQVAGNRKSTAPKAVEQR